MTDPLKVSAGKIIGTVSVVVGLSCIAYSVSVVFPWWYEGCFSIFPHEVSPEIKEEAVYPWKVCQKGSGECVTVNYPKENNHPSLSDGCFTYRGIGELVSFCGVEIEARSLPKKVKKEARKAVLSGWLEKTCMDTTMIDAAIDNAFKDFELECAHLVVTTGKMWDCRENSMIGIEELSGVPLQIYDFPHD